MKMYHLNRGSVGKSEDIKQAIWPTCERNRALYLNVGLRESPQLSGVARGLLLQHANLVEHLGIRRLKPDLIYEKIRPQINVRR
jgi:hypothetical protein